jgi:hypothetical protein
MSIGDGDFTFDARALALAPEYPIPRDAPFRGDWFAFKFDRFLNSDFVGRVDPAHGFFGVILWAASARQNPCGSLPADHGQLARLAGLGRDVAGWREVAPGALHGWQLCTVPLGDGEAETRLYHPVVTSVISEAMGRMVRTAEASAAGSGRKTRSRLLDAMRAAGCTNQDCKSPEFVAAVEAELQAMGEGPRTAERVAEAVTRAARALSGVVRIANSR